MKCSSTLPFLAALLLLPFGALAQIGAATATPNAAKKGSPLSSSDKQLVKKAGEAQLGLLHLSEIVHGASAPGAEAVQKLGEKTTTSVNSSWGELGTVISGRGAELPKTDVTPAEKKDLADIRKATGEKFDKAFLKAFVKETKRTAAVFGEGAKGASDADLRAYFAKWQPTMSTLNDQVNAAEAEESKKK